MKKRPDALRTDSKERFFLLSVNTAAIIRNERDTWIMGMTCVYNKREAADRQTLLESVPLYQKVFGGCKNVFHSSFFLGFRA